MVKTHIKQIETDLQTDPLFWTPLLCDLWNLFTRTTLERTESLSHFQDVLDFDVRRGATLPLSFSPMIY